MLDVKDQACVGECPVECIDEGERMLYTHPDECKDCGTCEPACPVEAIFCEDDVPGQGPVHGRERQLLRPARLARRRVQGRAAALRHRLCHQPTAAPCPDPDTQRGSATAG